MNLQRFIRWFFIALKNFLVLGVTLVLLTQSVLPPADQQEQIRAFTRDIEFNYVNWSLDAMAGKYAAFTVSTPRYLTVEQQRQIVNDYLNLVDQIDNLSAQIETIYADPKTTDPRAATADLSKQLAALKEKRSHLQPMAEAVLQYQVSVTIGEEGLGTGGQPIPPVLYHVTDLPYALIVSPRNVIRQEANISLVPGLSIDQITTLEQSVEKKLDVSALVVPVGGVGIYPTMVMSTTNLPWLLETISHEWTHNYLTLRPLGVNYDTTAQLRTMNETTANISGKEMGYLTLLQFYPDLAAKVSPPPSLVPEAPQAPNIPAPTPQPVNPNEFNFNQEMHKTRVEVDTLLAAGKISEAESYMETRRLFFWDHGYHIRKLNQAYFAFYGAYADEPGGGAAGKDPVGPAVQLLRSRSTSLADFLNRIAWMTNFSQLENALK